MFIHPKPDQTPETSLLHFPLSNGNVRQHDLHNQMIIAPITRFVARFMTQIWGVGNLYPLAGYLRQLHDLQQRFWKCWNRNRCWRSLWFGPGICLRGEGNEVIHVKGRRCGYEFLRQIGRREQRFGLVMEGGFENDSADGNGRWERGWIWSWVCINLWRIVNCCWTEIEFVLCFSVIFIANYSDQRNPYAFFDRIPVNISMRKASRASFSVRVRGCECKWSRHDIAFGAA